MHWNAQRADPESWPAIGGRTFPALALATVPADLRQWVSELTLVRWILEIVSDLHFPQATSGAAAAERPSPCTLLSVITFCYATGRYPSEEIELVAVTDPTVQYLCSGPSPSAATVRRFRRAHRTLLSRCLLALHRRAWLHRFVSGRAAQEPPATLRGIPATENDLLAYRLAGSAEAKIQQAILADTIAADV